MENTEIKRALSMLREAQQLLKDSKVANLKRSAAYLSESLLVLQQKTN